MQTTTVKEQANELLQIALGVALTDGPTNLHLLFDPDTLL
jgi:hypothetical protein